MASIPPSHRPLSPLHHRLHSLCSFLHSLLSTLHRRCQSLVQTRRHPPPPSPLLALPPELRQYILLLALAPAEDDSADPTEIQFPPWHSSRRAHFLHPLFSTARQLRLEALPIFYQTRAFLWDVDVHHKRRSDPVLYPIDPALPPSPRRRSKKTSRNVLLPSSALVAPPALPWSYPHLFPHLRSLHLHLSVPARADADAWAPACFPRYLAVVVGVLEPDEAEAEARLDRLCVRLDFGGARRYPPPLTAERVAVLAVLGRLRVRKGGRVSVRVEGAAEEVGRGVEGLRLESKIGGRL